MYDTNTSGVVFADFLSNFLTPSLTQPRLFLWDNLNAHTTPLVRNVIAASSHSYVHRPAYSPDMGPIECPFYIIKSYLRRHQFVITRANLANHIEDAIASITPAMCSGWFHRCGYM
jgi:transposase